MKVGYQILADLQQQQAFKQWGYYVESQNPTDYRYWSIPFTSHYITMATKTYYEPKEEAVPWLVGIDMQKFICGYGANFIGSSYVSCVGIGCQPQWGLGSPSINFPIAFPKECFIAAITRAAGNYEHSIVITTKNKTNLSWICKGYDNSAGNTYANWLALGCQLQWGVNRTNGIYSFPIPFTEARCCFGGGGAGSGYYDNASAYSNTQVYVYSDGSSRFVSWIAIGA